MDRLKIYLDTSVISHLDHPDAPEKMQDTQLLWALLGRDLYDVIVSEATLEELNRCAEPKRSYLRDMLARIPYTLIPSDAVTVALAEKLVDFGILRQKSFDDCRHIAAALVSGCNIILSWNFKHIVNYKTISGVKQVSIAEGYHDLMIYTPTFLIGAEEDDS
ncbi:MAG: PIN domain-containing protein [Firmicutes bacterium]|nr:PIN domain-containing protein [Bacillota bacterium]